LRIAQQVVDAVRVIVAGKALPKPISVPKAPEGLTKDNLKPKEAKARALKLAYKEVDKV